LAGLLKTLQAVLNREKSQEGQGNGLKLGKRRSEAWGKKRNEASRSITCRLIGPIYTTLASMSGYHPGP
jgi:hypothetical protein